MGGERRRRRLRRGRSPSGEPPAGSAPNGSAETGQFDTAACGTPSGADSELAAGPSGLTTPAPGTIPPSTGALSAGPAPHTADIRSTETAQPGTAAPNADTAQPADRLSAGEADRAERSASRRGGQRGRGSQPAPNGTQHRPSPADLAELAGPFALTAGVQDPEPAADQHIQPSAQHGDDPTGERGLRGLVGGGSSQVNVAAAMRARDASRPSDEHLAAAEADLPIVRRGWVPRDELPRPGAH